MKKLKISLIALGLFISMQSFAKTKDIKPLENNSKKEITIDLSQFGKYLLQDNSKIAEGVYSTEDGRYVIAIIKNSEKTHDYIGVVLSADNPHWKEGEVKFNFILDQENKLIGYYYDSAGAEHQISFDLDENGIVCDFLKKISVKELRDGGIALL